MAILSTRAVITQAVPTLAWWMDQCIFSVKISAVSCWTSWVVVPVVSLPNFTKVVTSSQTETALNHNSVVR